MYYGIQFKNDAGLPCQLVISTSTNNVLVRSSHNGAWTEWKRIDVDRKADGTLDESVFETEKAKIADTAMRLHIPIKIIIDNVEIEFDGSKDIVINIQGKINQAIREHLDSYHKNNYRT